MTRKLLFSLLFLFCTYLILHFSLTHSYNIYRQEEMPETYSYYQQNSSSFSDSAYKALYYSILNHKDKIYFDPITNRFTPEEIKTIIDTILNDYPEIFWLNPSTPITYAASSLTNHVLYVRFNYIFTKDEILENKTVFQINFNPLEEELKETDEIEERLQIIRDWVVKNVTYSDTIEATHTAQGAIAMKSACCDGISKAAQIALRKCGYTADLIKGTVFTGSSTEQHAWLYVTDNASHSYLVDYTFALSHPTDTTHWYTEANFSKMPIDANSIFSQYTPTLSTTD